MKIWFISLFIFLSFFSKGEDKSILDDKKRFLSLNQKYSLKKKSFKQKSNIQILRKEYLNATLNFAQFVLYCKCLPPKIKYPRALYLYREALSIDAHEKSAIDSINLIESIYKSMGRPIPK